MKLKNLTYYYLSNTNQIFPNFVGEIKKDFDNLKKRLYGYN